MSISSVFAQSVGFYVAKFVTLCYEFVMRVFVRLFMCAGLQVVMISRDFRLLICVHVALERRNLIWGLFG